MSVKFIEFKNDSILYVDHRKDKSEKEMLESLKECIEIEKTIEENYLILANFEDAFVSFRYMEIQNEFGKILQREKKAKVALVGISGYKTLLLSAYKKCTGHTNIETFRNEKDAKKWLVSMNYQSATFENFAASSQL